MWITSRTFPAVAFTPSLLPSIALYGLLLFYGLTKDDLVGRKPLAKFLSIKLIVMFTFYQSFVVRSPELLGPSNALTHTHTLSFDPSLVLWRGK